MNYLNDHIIFIDSTIKQALEILDKQGLISNVLFVTDKNNILKGSITDGDIRRSLLRGNYINESVEKAMNTACRYIKGKISSKEELNGYKKAHLFFLPVVDEAMKVVSIININHYKSFLPVDAIIMAGGEGKRLLPLTLRKPKPLLEVGEKPIIEHNIDRIKSFGIHNIYISINYLGNQLISYFSNGHGKGISIHYITEDKPLGTIGAAEKVKEELVSDAVLIMNSDLLTNIDFEEFYNAFIDSNADMAVAATSYNVDIPYAVMEVHKDNSIYSLKEKPRYTYYSNAGIYLVKKEMLSYLPSEQTYDSTDFIELLISKGKKVITFPILGYWLDIGKMEDYQKAQEDIKHINFS